MGAVRLRRRAALIAGALGLATPVAARAAAPPCVRESDECSPVRITVRRAGDRVPVAGTRVTLAEPGARPSWTAAALTDAEGHVERVLPTGAVRVVVLGPGFERFDAIVEVGPATGEVLVVLEPSSSNPYRTTVTTPRDVQPGVTSRRLDREEIATMPGTQGDALRALQSLPGVARTPGGLGLLVLRGASPSQSVIFVGEHRVPRAFHALAISSVVPADALAEVEMVPGNYSSRYGNGTGGAVVLRPRTGRRDGVHGYGEIDLAAAGGMLEGPLGRGSFLAAAQRSYIDAALRVVETIDPTQTFVLPSAWDYQLFVDHPLAPGTTIAARVLGSEDRLVSRFRNDGEFTNSLELTAGFHRADLELRHRHGPWRLLVSPSFRFEHQALGLDERTARRRDRVTSGRAELSVELGPRATLTVGADVEIDAFRARSRTPDSGSEYATIDALQTSTGVYVTSDLRLGRLTLMPGARLNAFTLDDAAKLSVDPRLLGRVEISPRWTWTAGVGLYSQPEISTDSSSGDQFLYEALGFGLVNRWRFPSAVGDLVPTILLDPESSHVRLAQALQASSAVTFNPTSAWSLEAAGYVRARDESLTYLGDQPISTRSPETYNYGAELLLRRHDVGRLYGWVAYTLSWARRRYGPPFADPSLVVDDFDQRHNLTVVGSLALARHWRIGGRFRLVSGSPFTPVMGAVDVPSKPNLIGSTAYPTSGPINSARFPVFHQLDLRVDKRWYLSRVIINAYLDVQNVYNRENVELYLFNADFRRHDAGYGLPIFPSLGLRVDF